MATSIDRKRPADSFGARFLAEATACISFKEQIVSKVNAIFNGKLLSDELEKLSSSISALLMNGERTDTLVFRSSPEQRKAALAVLDDKNLEELLKTRPTAMWEKLIIEKMVAAQLEAQKLSSGIGTRQ